MVDAPFPGLHVALMPPLLCVLAGQGPTPSPPLSLDLGGPKATDLEHWTKWGSLWNPEAYGWGSRATPYLPCPMSPGPQVVEATGAVCSLSASVTLVTNSSHVPAPVSSCCGCPDGHPQMPLSSHREPSWPLLVSSISCPPARLGESRTVSGAMPWLKLALAFLTWASCHPLSEPPEATSWGRAHRGPTDTAPPHGRQPGPESPRAVPPHTLSPAGNWVLSRLKTKAGAAFSGTS